MSECSEESLHWLLKTSLQLCCNLVVSLMGGVCGAIEQ